jgi:hypothetical protein
VRVAGRHWAVHFRDLQLREETVARDDVRIGLIAGTGIIFGSILGGLTMRRLLTFQGQPPIARGASVPPPPPPPSEPPHTPNSTPVPPGSTGQDERGPFYVVARGDYGALIVSRLGHAGEVRALVEANPQITNWPAVRVGTRLRLPVGWP